MRAAGSDLTFSQSTLASMRRRSTGNRRRSSEVRSSARVHRPAATPALPSSSPGRPRSNPIAPTNSPQIKRPRIRQPFLSHADLGLRPMDSRQPKITGINVVELAAFPALESPCGDTGPLPLPDPIQDHPPHRLKTDSISRRPRASGPVASTPSAPRESISWAWACSLSWRSLNPTASLPGLAEEMSETKGYRPGDF